MAAIETVKLKPAAGEPTKAALLRNLDIASKLGCLDSAGLDDVRHGKGRYWTRNMTRPSKFGTNSVRITTRSRNKAAVTCDPYPVETEG